MQKTYIQETLNRPKIRKVCVKNMKKKIADLLKNKKIAGGCAAVALAVIIGGTSLMQQATTVPELPTYQDPVMEVSVEEEETPLASKPTVKTKTSKKTTKKNVKLSKAATKTYSKKLPTKKKTTSKTSTSKTQKVVTKTTVTTAQTEKYTKKSKTKVVTTTTTTTVTTTTTKLATTSTSKTSNTTAKGKYEVSISKIAPKADARVLSAYQTLGFKVYVDSTVSYSGYFDAKTRSITLKAEDDTIYHELGHFLAFIAGNVDKASDFAAVYSKEKNSYSGVNKTYVTQNASEYFAESYRDYVLNAGVLKTSRPNTYASLTSALNKVTTAQITKLQKLYAAIWK